MTARRIVSLRMPADLIEQVDLAAEAVASNRSEWLINAAEERLARQASAGPGVFRDPPAWEHIDTITSPPSVMPRPASSARRPSAVQPRWKANQK